MILFFSSEFGLDWFHCIVTNRKSYDLQNTRQEAKLSSIKTMHITINKLPKLMIKKMITHNTMVT